MKMQGLDFVFMTLV